MAEKPNSAAGNASAEDERTGLDVASLRSAIHDNLFYRCGNIPRLATPRDYYQAVAYTVRDRLMQRWLSNAMALLETPGRAVCYLSAEYLLGRHLGNALLNLDIRDEVAQAVDDLGQNLDQYGNTAAVDICIVVELQQDFAGSLGICILIGIIEEGFRKGGNIALDVHNRDRIAGFKLYFVNFLHLPTLC